MKMNKNELIINNIKTSMEMENQFLTDRDINVLNNFADDKITLQDAISTFKTDAISSFKKMTF